MMKTQSIQTGLLFAVTIAASFLIVTTAYANPSFFGIGVTTNSAASTSPAYMTPGTGTSTTPVYNALAQTFAGGATAKTDSVGLLVRFCASSSAAVLTIAQENSADGIDYYRNFVLDPMTIGTTTNPMSLNTPFSTRWSFASSSLNGAATVSQTCSTASLVMPTPFQYMRFVSTLTGANGSVWMQVVPIKEKQ